MAAGFRHISTRLIVWLVGVAGLALVVIGYQQQQRTRRIVLEQVSGRAAAYAVSINEELQGMLRVVEAEVHLTTARVENWANTPERVDRVLREMIESNPRIYGATASFESFATPDGSEHFGPYYFRGKDGALAKKDLAAPDYAYWTREWYRQPLIERRAVWSEPYFDEGGGNILMVTRAQPLFRPGGDNKPIGVVTADISLAWLKRFGGENKPGDSGFVIIFSGSGRIVTHPRTKYILNQTLADIAKSSGRPELLTVQAEVAAGRSGSLVYPSPTYGSTVHIDYRPIKVGGWGLIVGYDEQEFLRPVIAAERSAMASAAAALVALAVIIAFISRRVTAPLRQLADSADAIAAGHFDTPIDTPRTRDEIGHLSMAFLHMRDKLLLHIEELKATTAAKQKLESELAIAQLIQRTMLPPPSRVIEGAHPVHIEARIVPAKAVGGDLYVYFQVAGRLVFAVGDVSDKGVPAALFMARTLTLLRTRGREAGSPDEILARVNAELFPDNDECMFVTIFCAVLDLASGELTSVSAGHEAPLIVRAGGQCEMWSVPNGPPLGLAADIELPIARQLLGPGDALLLYTDGVTDAADAAGRLLTTEGLVRLVKSLPSDSGKLADALLAQVQAFAKGAEQSDDISILVLRRG
jgi:sigma-B regulation protein RsbU (phosphoserine phosphatase)